MRYRVPLFNKKTLALPIPRIRSVGHLQSVQAQNTADDVATQALSSQRLPPIASRLEALGRTFHKQ